VKNVLTVFVAVGSIAAAAVVTSSSADAQRGGIRVPERAAVRLATVALTGVVRLKVASDPPHRCDKSPK
jgi:hypothetical protein